MPLSQLWETARPFQGGFANSAKNTWPSGKTPIPEKQAHSGPVPAKRKTSKTARRTGQQKNTPAKIPATAALRPQDILQSSRIRTASVQENIFHKRKTTAQRNANTRAAPRKKKTPGCCNNSVQTPARPRGFQTAHTQVHRAQRRKTKALYRPTAKTAAAGNSTQAHNILLAPKK